MTNTHSWICLDACVGTVGLKELKHIVGLGWTLLLGGGVEGTEYNIVGLLGSHICLIGLDVEGGGRIPFFPTKKSNYT